MSNLHAAGMFSGTSLQKIRHITFELRSSKKKSLAWWSDVCLPVHVGVVLFSQPFHLFLCSLLLQPEKFDSAPYNSQGHLHLRPSVVAAKLNRR